MRTRKTDTRRPADGLTNTRCPADSLTKRRLFRALLVVLCTALLVPAGARALGGDAGDGVNWALESDGTLYVRGTGSMTDYIGAGRAPWTGDARYLIRTVRVESGVRNVGNYAFTDLPRLETVILASSVQSVGSYAFYGCGVLSTVELGGVRSLDTGAFSRCGSLQTLDLRPGGVLLLRRSGRAGPSGGPDGAESLRVLPLYAPLAGGASGHAGHRGVAGL